MAAVVQENGVLRVVPGSNRSTTFGETTPQRLAFRQNSNNLLTAPE
jgi:hypothetical protein